MGIPDTTWDAAGARHRAMVRLGGEVVLWGLWAWALWALLGTRSAVVQGSLFGMAVVSLPSAYAAWRREMRTLYAVVVMMQLLCAIEFGYAIARDAGWL
jgi:hypothetical protein